MPLLLSLLQASLLSFLINFVLNVSTYTLDMPECLAKNLLNELWSGAFVGHCFFVNFQIPYIFPDALSDLKTFKNPD